MSKSDPFDDMFTDTHKGGKASWEPDDDDEENMCDDDIEEEEQ